MIMHVVGKSHEDIAEVFDLSESIIETKIYRIKKKFKEHFKTE